jgi:predicted O-methyltransferase YrrM
MSNQTLNLTPELYDYLRENSVREPEVLQQLREQTMKMSTAGMQISPEQGQFMALLIALIGARKTLEIGVYTGYSTLAVALALPADGKIVACDINTDWTRIARRFWEKGGIEQKIDLRIAPAIVTLHKLIAEEQSETFDFAFIDADKVNYLQYYELSLQLVRVGGLILLDNVLWGGDVTDKNIQDENTRAIRELNKKIYTDQRVTISLLPIGDGLTLAMKK